MAKLSLAALAALVASTAAFAPTQNAGRVQTAMKASAEIWDPMGLYELGEGKAFDTFPNMFPSKQYLDESEIKHGRQAMLAWTGIWATHEVSFALERDENMLPGNHFSHFLFFRVKREDLALD
jgi:hypothetical protein